MSYLPQGGWLSTAAEYYEKLKPVAQISGQVLSDPYLPETGCEVTRLSKAQGGLNPGPSCARTTSTSTSGVGLRYVVGPLRAYTWHRQYPWALPMAGLAALALIYYAGQESGRRR